MQTNTRLSDRDWSILSPLRPLTNYEPRRHAQLAPCRSLPRARQNSLSWAHLTPVATCSLIHVSQNLNAIIKQNIIKVSESRLNGVTAISIIGEVPKGRAYILANKLGEIKKLLDDPSDLVRAAARECCSVIEWKP